MSTRRKRRRSIALIALLGLLFQQFAIASYVCPLDMSSAIAAAEMSPCQQADGDRARCHEHCHPLSQVSDHAPAPTVPAAALPPNTWLPEAGLRQQAVSDQFTAEITARAAAPPLTIRDCTFQL